jgi:hypothetical protein
MKSRQCQCDLGGFITQVMRLFELVLAHSALDLPEMTSILLYCVSVSGLRPCGETVCSGAGVRGNCPRIACLVRDGQKAAI